MKGHQKNYTTDVSSQALLNYLQNRDSKIKSHTNFQSLLETKIVQASSPLLKKKSDSSRLTQIQTTSKLQKSISPLSPKNILFTGGIKQSSPQLNLRILTKHLLTESSIYQDSPTSRLKTNMSPQAKDNLKTEYDGQQFSTRNMPQTTKHLKTQQNKMTSSGRVKLEEASNKLKVMQSKQHLRLLSLNDEICLKQLKQKISQRDKLSVDKISPVDVQQQMLSFNNLLKNTNEQFKKSTPKNSETTKHSNSQFKDLQGLFMGSSVKQNTLQSAQIQEVLRSNQKKYQETINSISSKPPSRQKKEELMIIMLIIKNKKQKLTIDVSSNNIEHLIESIRQEVIKQDEFGHFIGIKSFFSSIPLDYILSMSNLPLSILNKFPNQPIILQPLYAIPREMKSKKVGLKDFDFIRCVGSGGFSKVYLVREKSTGTFFAMKLIEKYSIFQQNKQCIVLNERFIMEEIDHPFIVKMHYSFESEHYLVFVLEYCQGGELFFLLRQIKRMKEEQAFFYFTQICLAMKCLHDNNIIYRDIKPENILIDIQGNIRIADFGLSKPNMDQDEMAYSFCGSPEYMAPEMLLKQGHNQLLDLYCLGALLYELVTGLPPFYCKNTEEIYRRIVNQKLTFPSSLPLSNSIKDLLNLLLMKNPNKRLNNMDMLFQHPWMQQFGGATQIRNILNKTTKPPFSHEYFRFNFDEDEFGKGEIEFLQVIRQLQGTVQENFPKEILVPNFYYSLEARRGKEKTICSTEYGDEIFSQRADSKNNHKRINTLEDYIDHLQSNKGDQKQSLMLKHLRMQTELDQPKQKNNTLKF